MKVVEQGGRVRAGQKFVHQNGKVYKVCKNDDDTHHACWGCAFKQRNNPNEQEQGCVDAPDCCPNDLNYVFKPVYFKGAHLTKEDVK